MPSWSFEVKDGSLATLPPALAAMAKEKEQLNCDFCLVAEAGLALHESVDQIVEWILPRDRPPAVIGRFSNVCAWLFEHLEIEVGQRFKSNYLKLSFINFNPIQPDAGYRAGKMTTNHPDFPAPSEQPTELMLRQMVISLRTFFCNLYGSVEVSGRSGTVYECDWATLTFSRVP